ncbi:MAG TPA: hypothetical protein VKS22_00540 [Candidatus Binataceae bacterium]|nr:hypothetical protein [Candidatus Binataceae bacterium]
MEIARRDATPDDRAAGDSYWAWLAVWLALGVITLLAIHRLRDFPATLSWRAAFDGIREVLPATAWAAIKVWLFWGLCMILLGGAALRLDPELQTSDALLIGAAAPWALAPILGNILGPLSLFNAATIWGLIALLIAWLWRKPPSLKFSPLSSGQKLALLATALLAVSYIPLQLASPVPPFMDVLSYPSSVQRILTFRVYLPFDNDPYGCWGRYAETPFLELFYAMLALGSGTRLAVLTETAAMMPMAALMIFAAWRLGKSLFGDTAGGFAALLLFSTDLFRRAQGMRGTAVDFALIGLALAFFLDLNRRRITLAAGALMLGIGVGSHAIIGAFGLITAGLGVLMWLVEGDYRRFFAGVLALFGASLCAFPELLIGLDWQVQYPILPLLLLSGLGLIVTAAALLAPQPQRLKDLDLRIINAALIGALLLAVIARHAFIFYSFYTKVGLNLPMLFLFGFGGLFATLGIITAERPLRARYAGIAAGALLLGALDDYLDPALRALGRTAATRMMTSDISIKLTDYWCPYFLIFPAGLLFALAYDRWSRPLTFLALMTLLIYPWRRNTDPIYYDSLEHTITEQWAFNLDTAADGYWAGHSDRRWTFDADEMELIKTLNAEIAAGRITPATHILHLTESISSYSLVQFSILTGINDDPIEYQHDPNNQWEGGSRVRGLDSLHEAMAGSPPYILRQDPPPPGFGDPPAGYDRLLDGGALQLYRRHDLATINDPPRRGLLRRFGLGVVLGLCAIVVLLGPRREQPVVGAHEAPLG